MWFGVFPANHPVLKRDTIPIIQSADVSTPVLAEQMTESPVLSENVEFVDAGGSVGTEEQFPISASYREQSDERANLGEYLHRPVQIDQFTWNESDDFSLSPHTIYPWTLYFSNAYLVKKLANFSRVNARLKLTFRFNASPFYYGAMRVCYDPLNTGKFAPVSTTDIIPLSQTHGVMIEPHVVSSMELELPFLYPYDWVDTSTAANFNALGNLVFQVFAPLVSANGVTGTGITVTTYAEAVDLQLAGPTLTAVMQSGPISGPAARIASTARRFSSDQSIGVFARAIDVGATFVSGVAKLFGYSNPPVMNDVQPFQNKVFHAFANTETSMPIDKLALDPNNEVTIDTRVAGADGKDELIISALATKPSIVAVVPWETGDAAGDVLCYGAVTPAVLQEVAGTSQQYAYRTPASWISALFRYWRGGMKYTFRVIRSKYHRGRLIISWDPNATATTPSETALFTKIFDLSSEEQEFDFVIPYKAIRPWLLTDTSIGVSTSSISYVASSQNGTFSLAVLNALTAPVDTAPVSILVSVAAADDIEFAGPCALDQLVTTAEVQSAAVDGSAISLSDHIHEVTFGERVASLRALLHRTSISLSQYLGTPQSSSGTAGSSAYHGVNFYPRYPPCAGFTGTKYGMNYALSVLDGVTKKQINYTHNHPINWVLAAFAGFRGSFVVHANVHASGTRYGVDGLSMTRTYHHWAPAQLAGQAVTNVAQRTMLINDGASKIGYNLLATVPGTLGTSLGVRWQPSGAGGMTVTHGHTQMALSAVIPQYCPIRFTPAWWTQRDAFDGADVGLDGFRVDGEYAMDALVASPLNFPRLDLYWAAGVDFTTVFFTGVPRMYRLASLPAPVTANWTP